MSQFYPQQSPSYPPQGPPEDDYYYEEDDYDYEEYEDGEESDNSLIKYAGAFLAGGCLVFLCMCCLFLMVGSVWTLDSVLAGTPIPGSDLGQSFDDPAYMDELVVNDLNVGLTVRRADRNASLPTVPQVEGREIIIITVELENLGSEKVKYSERDFLLLNSVEEAYAPTPGETAIEGALGKGTLDVEEGLQGRLVFEVLAGEPELVLAWEARDSSSRYVSLR